MNKWLAEITNDPQNDYRLYIELSLDNESIGKIYRNEEKILTLEFYDMPKISVPLEWLCEIADRAKKDLSE